MMVRLKRVVCYGGIMDYNVVSDGMSMLEIASAGQRFVAFLADFVISVVVGIAGLIIGSAS